MCAQNSRNSTNRPIILTFTPQTRRGRANIPNIPPYARLGGYPAGGGGGVKSLVYDPRRGFVTGTRGGVLTGCVPGGVCVGNGRVACGMYAYVRHSVHRPSSDARGVGDAAPYGGCVTGGREQDRKAMAHRGWCVMRLGTYQQPATRPVGSGTQRRAGGGHVRTSTGCKTSR